MKRRVYFLAAAAATIAATALVTTAAATATAAETPLTTACPAGYELLAVASLEAQGPYLVPRRIDTAGNHNGYVCGRAQPDAVRDAMCMIFGGNACNLQALGLPRFLFIDDDNPAAVVTLP
jgi:hypothetical protein